MLPRADEITSVRPPLLLDKAEAWRLEQLLDAGYPLELAEPLSARTDIDLHQAVELAASCPPTLAARILL